MTTPRQRFRVYGGLVLALSAAGTALLLAFRGRQGLDGLPAEARTSIMATISAVDVKLLATSARPAPSGDEFLAIVPAMWRERLAEFSGVYDISINMRPEDWRPSAGSTAPHVFIWDPSTGDLLAVLKRNGVITTDGPELGRIVRELVHDSSRTVSQVN